MSVCVWGVCVCVMHAHMCVCECVRGCVCGWVVGACVTLTNQHSVVAAVSKIVWEGDVT